MGKNVKKGKRKNSQRNEKRITKTNSKVRYPETSYQLIAQQGVFQYLQIHAEETAIGFALKFQQ